MRDLPRFPGEREKLLEDVAEYRDSSPEERLEALFGLSRLCDDILEASSHRERQIALLDENEELEHRRWREFIERHAPGPIPSA